MQKKAFIIIVLILGFAIVIGCGGSSGGSAADKIIGKWQGDAEAMEKDPDVQKMLEENPMASMMIEMVAGITFEITKDTMTVEMEFMGQAETQSSGYKIISSTGDSVIVENTDGDKAGDQVEIKIVDDNHIKILIDEEGAPPFVLKKI